MSSRLFAASQWRVGLTQRLMFAPRRCYSQNNASFDPTPAEPSKTDLPPIDRWRETFPMALQVGHRVSVRNPDTAAQLAEAFVPEGSTGKVIIEAFPGPGQLTRALLRLPKERVRRIIVMEDWENYLQYLRPLELLDPRLKVINQDGHAWSTYQLVEDMGLLSDVPLHGWENGVHPQLQFISHFPSTVMGEQLVAQLFRAIPERHWLFKYGRVPLNFILSDHVYQRVTATTKQTKMRCKVSVVAEAVANCNEAVPFDALQPYEDKFHPRKSATLLAELKKRNSRWVGNPFRAMHIVPLEHQIIGKGGMDAWDYCLRRLFVQKATPLKTALPSLAPGAGTLIKMVSDPNLPPSERLDVKKQIRAMTAKDWSILLKAFDEWPFAPEDLGIGETFHDRL